MVMRSCWCNPMDQLSDQLSDQQSDQPLPLESDRIGWRAALEER